MKLKDLKVGDRVSIEGEIIDKRGEYRGKRTVLIKCVGEEWYFYPKSITRKILSKVRKGRNVR